MAAMRTMSMVIDQLFCQKCLFSPHLSSRHLPEFGFGFIPCCFKRVVKLSIVIKKNHDIGLVSVTTSATTRLLRRIIQNY